MQRHAGETHCPPNASVRPIQPHSTYDNMLAVDVSHALHASTKTIWGALGQRMNSVALHGRPHTRCGSPDPALGAQVHEWGGVFTDIVTYSHYRQFQPGLRIAINSHGGHYWSTQARPRCNCHPNLLLAAGMQQRS